MDAPETGQRIEEAFYVYGLQVDNEFLQEVN